MQQYLYDEVISRAIHKTNFDRAMLSHYDGYNIIQLWKIDVEVEPIDTNAL